MQRGMIWLAVVALCACLWPAVGFADDAGALSETELNTWVAQVLRDSARETPMNAPVGEESRTEDGYAFLYSFATLYYNKPTLDEESKLLGVSVTDEGYFSPRGARMGSDGGLLVSSYGWQNPGLLGDGALAAFYWLDDLPRAAYWSWAQCDNGTLQSVQCAVHVNTGDGRYTDAGLLYTLENGKISGIRAYGLNALISAEEVASNLTAVKSVQAAASVPASGDASTSGNAPASGNASGTGNASASGNTPASGNAPGTGNAFASGNAPGIGNAPGTASASSTAPAPGAEPATPGYTNKSASAKLSASDLRFGGIDYETLTPQGAQAAFGKAADVQRVRDDTGAWLVTESREGLELSFLVSDDGAGSRLESLSLTGDLFAGPRGLRIGATLSEALSAFYSDGEGRTAGGAAILYGDGVSAPSGLMERPDGHTAELRFLVQPDEKSAERTVTVKLAFVDDTLKELMVYSW